LCVEFYFLAFGVFIFLRILLFCDICVGGFEMNVLSGKFKLNIENGFFFFFKWKGTKAGNFVEDGKIELEK